MGTIIFTETGFILTTKDGDVEVYQKSESVGDKYVVLDDLKYKWVNQPKSINLSDEDSDDDEDSDEEE